LRATITLECGHTVAIEEDPKEVKDIHKERYCKKCMLGKKPKHIEMRIIMCNHPEVKCGHNQQGLCAPKTQWEVFDCPEELKGKVKSS